MLDLYVITIIIGITTYMCYNSYLLWKEAHEDRNHEK